MSRLILTHTVLITVLLAAASNSLANTVVRFTTSEGGVESAFALKLYDDDTPETVTNFMRYVDDGSYIHSFIHRSVPGFIVQGGGYVFNPADTNLSTSVAELTSKGTVINEPGISNVRGTVAMAKLDGLPDSATSQWFVNLDDNSAILDAQNGGFTVFGEVIDSGMATVDSIAAVPIYDIGAPFTEIPLVDYTSGPVLTSHVVEVTNVEKLFRISADYDYGVVTATNNVQPLFFIENISDTDIIIGGIGTTNPADLPFKVVDLECRNSILEPGETCYFVVVFAPDAAGTFSDSFNIEFPELGFDYTINLAGIGGAEIDEPDISLSFGARHNYLGEYDVIEGQVAKELYLGFQNRGGLDLDIQSVELVTADTNEFILSGDCLDLPVLIPGSTCSLTIAFSPLSAGNKSATVDVKSNDPDEPVFDLLVDAVALAENDGVDAAIEDAGPNNGDGNYDGIPDSKQGYVATLPTLDGRYITLMGESSIRFTNVHFEDRQNYTDVPANVAMGTGVLRFGIDGSKYEQVINIGAIMPVSTNPQSFYIFGPTTDDPDVHWYDFIYDNETGIFIVPSGSLVSDDGTTATGAFVSMYLKNGGRGDSSTDIDESIDVTGGFKTVPADSGAMSMVYLLVMTTLVGMLRSVRSRPDSRT